MQVRNWSVLSALLALMLAFLGEPAFSATVSSDPTNGSVINHGDGVFTYTPNADFNGTDSFDYRICDTDGLCATATVMVQVMPVNDAPVAVDDHETTSEDTPVTINVLANDTDVDDNLVVNGGARPTPNQAIGLVIDSGDPVLTQMGHELSKFVRTDTAAIWVKLTLGPVANVRRMLSRENAGLGIVPSDMLHYTERSDDLKLRRAAQHLRFIMTMGTKEVHLLARKYIERFEDLEGQRVVVGESDTGVWVTAQNLLALMGVTPAVQLQKPPAEAIGLVLMDKADAAFIIGDAPIPLITQIDPLQQDGVNFGALVNEVHLLPLTDPRILTAYPRATVNYPGFAEAIDTVAIHPTLVSFDFTGQSRYYRQRCNAFSAFGATLRQRLPELQRSGHPKWQEATLSLEMGAWEQDGCFYGSSSPLSQTGHTASQ